jgi:hypothetical protein
VLDKYCTSWEFYKSKRTLAQKPLCGVPEREGNIELRLGRHVIKHPRFQLMDSTREAKFICGKMRFTLQMEEEKSFTKFVEELEKSVVSSILKFNIVEWYDSSIVPTRGSEDFSQLGQSHFFVHQPSFMFSYSGRRSFHLWDPKRFQRDPSIGQRRLSGEADRSEAIH